MPIPSETITKIANSYIAALDGDTPIEPVAGIYPNLPVEAAYQVRDAVVARFEGRGHRIKGYKCAATSAAAQAKMGLTEPIYAALLDFHEVEPGATLPADHTIQPHIECELAFVMGQTLTGPDVTPEAVLAATRHIVPAYDIIDFRTTGWATGMAEALCSNGFARHYVLGRQTVAPDALDWPQVAISLAKNGETVAEATAAAIMGHPARAIAWLANKLAEHGRSLETGQFALTGAITSPYPFAAGDRFEASFEGMGKLACGFN